MASRTPNTSTKTVRCKATEGAQQCLSATHGKMQNHRFGKPGETEQWNADGSPKIPDPAADTEQLPEVTPDPALAAEARRLVVEEQEMERYRAAERQRLADTPTIKTAEARELLRNQPPTGPLDSEVHAQALSQGLVRPKVADEADQAELERVRAAYASHPHVLADGPRPVSVSGAPGSRLADVTSLVSTWTQLGIPVELQDEMTQIQLAKLALDSMLEEIIRTRAPSDPALVASLLDAVDHIARARGLVRGTEARS